MQDARCDLAANAFRIDMLFHGEGEAFNVRVYLYRKL
jgi:hypothetical protein